MSNIITTAFLSAAFAVIIMLFILLMMLVLELFVKRIRRLFYNRRNRDIYMCSCGGIVSASDTVCPFCGEKVKFRLTGKL